MDMVIFSQKQIVIARNYPGKLYMYEYEQGKVTKVTVIREDLRFWDIELARNQFLLFARNTTALQVLSVEFSCTQTFSTFNNADTKMQSDCEVLINNIYSLLCQANHFYSISEDGNEILIAQKNSPQISIYSMCLTGTYYASNGCLKCANNCSTCHITSDTCTNCPNNTFALFNQTCLSCDAYLPGCLTCFDSQTCLLCNQNKNWNTLPTNGFCECQQFYFLSQKQCKSCDSFGACRTCTSQSQCTQCDLYKGYKEKPVDSKCVCRRQFSSVNQKCVECDIEGCERCEKANVCSLCSEVNGYDSDAGSNGECIKKSSSWITVVLSIIGGFLILLASIYVYCKCKGKRKFQRNELKEESYIEDQSYKQILSGGLMDHKRVSVRESVPRFKQIEQILRQSIKKQIKVGVPIAAVNKKEYAKFSDEQKFRLRQLLQQSNLPYQ